MEGFIETGKALGLEGDELKVFVEEKEVERLAREERKEAERLAREDKKEAERLAREDKREAENKAREERMKERELKMKEFDRIEKEKEREYELAKKEAEMKVLILEKEIELEKTRKLESIDLDTSLTGKQELRAKIPKLPPFNEKHDNMDAYLKRFERFAENAGWAKKNWATNLSALVQGKALDVYSRLSPADSLEYDKLKEALLKRFQLTEEGFRLKFRGSKPEIGETPPQFVGRLEEYLRRWMNLANVTEDYDGLKDLVLREQFMQASSKNLQVFLKERKVKSVKEMAELAEQYNEAHGTYESQRSKFNIVKPEYESPSRKFTRPQLDRNQGTRDRYCYHCKSTSHFIRDCPKKSFSGRGKTIKAAALSDQTSEQDGRGSYRSYGRGISRGSNRGRGGHNNSYGHRTVQTDKDDETEAKTLAGCGINEGITECCLGDDTVKLECGHELPVMTAACKNTGASFKVGNMPICNGYVNDTRVTVLRDTGCSSAVVRRDLVTQDKLTGKKRLVVLLDGTVRKFPLARVSISTPFFVGEYEALCAENPVFDLILGNIPNVREPNNPDLNWQEYVNPEDTEIANAVQTRAQRSKEGKFTPLQVPSQIGSIDKEEVRKYQETDESLKIARQLADTGEKRCASNGDTYWYEKKNKLIYRLFQSSDTEKNKLFKQLLVPTKLRDQVLRLAHDSVLAGHLGVKKTKERILAEFYWPGVQGDITRYCQSCDICQKTFPKGKVPKIPVGELPLIDTPFSRVAVDLVGPIHPSSDKGNRFILTMMDYATRYPEAKALKYIDSNTVAEALFQMFCRVGIPREVLSDMGKQFTSDVMKEVGRLLSIKQLTTTPYNPACNGLVERFNGTLKTMLKKLCVEKPKHWDRYIDPLLFAYREAPQDSLGFSPFELLYGRTVRGPLCILKELWTNESQTDEVRTTYEYVVDLRNRLEETLEIAREELEKNRSRYKFYADRKRKGKDLEPGMKVLVLLPTDNNKLLMQLKGPYVIKEKINKFDYKIDVNGKEKIYHANLLRRYLEREDDKADENVKDNLEEGIVASFVEQVCVSVVEESEYQNIEELSKADMTEPEYEPDSYIKGQAELVIELPRLEPKETVDDIKINPELNKTQKEQIQALVSEYSDVLTDLPGKTTIIEHEIKLVSDNPVRSRPYSVPHALKDIVKSEIENMLRMGIIEQIESPYASPIVIVKKSDGTNRFCIDYRKLNRITRFDAEPIGNPDEIFARLSKGTYFSKLDLSKGYWQIPVKKCSQMATAFISSEGLYAFKFMPFGLVNAGATFCRMMRILLRGMQNVDNFVDDILEHTETWETHLDILRELFNRLREAGLTVKPSKCILGYFQLPFLGHTIGNGCISPDPGKIESIKECSRPSSKKQIRSFLGLVGYYRKFIPNFSTIAAVLTDMTKKGAPSKVTWSSAAEVAFQSLIGSLCNRPILCLPDFDLDFILRTDASDFGLGAVLMQEHDGLKFPVCYASRKLLGREMGYSVIEKECLSIIWAIQKFESYLYGREFLLETDHQPLVYLNRAKVANARLMRWALALQPYRFRIIAIKGSENVGADFLSRHPSE